MTSTAIPSPPFLATNDLSTEFFPTVSECTVAQAATILDMSEACLNDLLKIGVFECRQENGERLIQMSRVLEYDRKQKWIESGLNKIAQWDQAMGLYDD